MSRPNKIPLRYNLIVRYLPLDLDEENLHCLFSSMGQILSVKLMRVKTGSEGYGFVNFAKKEDAERAIQYFDGYQISARKTLKVSWSVPGKRVACKVFVTNIPRHWDQYDFQIAFQTKGIAEEVRLLGLRNGRCSGFILFFNAEYAKRAIEAMNGVVPKNGTMPLIVEHARRTARKIHESPVQPIYNTSMGTGLRKVDLNSSSDEIADTAVATSPNKDPSPRKNIIFFYNACTHLPEKFLQSLFSHYGTLVEFVVQKDQNGGFVGMGFADYEDIRSVKLCYEGLNRANIHGKQLCLRLGI